MIFIYVYLLLYNELSRDVNFCIVDRLSRHTHIYAY